MSVNVLVGYDGSIDAMAAIDAGADVLPGAEAAIAYIWNPPFASAELRRRVRACAHDLDDLNEMTAREGEREARFLADTGVALARYRQWNAEPLVKQTWGGEGSGLAELADRRRPDLTIVGARGIGGAQRFLGSVSDLVVRHASGPVLIVPRPMFAAEHAALAAGPILVGTDGSEGADAALDAARALFPQRRVLPATVGGRDSTADGDDGSVLRLDSGGGTGPAAVSHALVRCADRQNAAVIVVGSRGQSMARRIILGSVTKATLHDATRPVLVVPPVRDA